MDRIKIDESNLAKTDINIYLSESFLEDIDVTWQEMGYESRSEFIHDVLRDAVKHPNFTRESWKEIAASEHARRTGESNPVSREEVLSSRDDSEMG